MIRISQMRQSLEEDQASLRQIILKKLDIKDSELLEYRIFKQSIDARRKDKIHFVYTVLVSVQDESKLLKKNKDKNISQAPDLSYAPSVGQPGTGTNRRPVVIGSGPAGLFAALVMARAGYRPILLERGKAVEKRVRDVDTFFQSGVLNTASNIQFGEGGAGTFSDGKLYTQIKDKRTRWVVEELVRHGAPADILYSFKPHIGTDILRDVVKNMRKSIIDAGGEIRFSSCVTDIIHEKDQITGIEIDHNDNIECDSIILAVGHSARDTFEMLGKQGVRMEAKTFSIGVRIEHLQTDIDRAQYGRWASHPLLKAAPYKLVQHNEEGRSLYTFCMCPGGSVVGATSEEACVVTNGMSTYARDLKNANSALLVNIHPDDFDNDPLMGIEFQRKWERQAFIKGGSNYKAPVQLAGDFLKDRPSQGPGRIKPSYKPGVHWTALHSCLPDYVIDNLKSGITGMDRRLKGFAHPEAVLTGVETRSSSPLRIPRDETFQANIRGLYPCGEGAGYAGGIISAAVDGLKCAEAWYHHNK